MPSRHPAQHRTFPTNYRPFVDHPPILIMGNTCGIGILTDRDSYSSGSTVRGTIYLQVRQQDGIPATSLKIRLRGEEATAVCYTEEEETHYDSRNHRSHGTRTIHHRATDTECIFNLDVPIATFPDGVVPPGRYEFPFQLTLSELPATMFFQDCDSKCEVRYSIKAYLVGIGGMFAGINSQTSNSRTLRILGTPREDDGSTDTGIELPPEIESVNTCCCSYRGTMTLQSEIDRGVLSPREQFSVSFRCKNDSTVSISKVEVKLYEKITWHARHRRTEGVRVLCRKFLLGDSIPELRELILVPRRHRAYDSVFFTDDQDKHIITLELPPDSRESYHGRLIEVSHFLTVTLKTPCCTSNPEACISVTVRPARLTGTPTTSQPCAPTPSAPPLEFDDETPIVESQTLPADWSAQTADLVSIPMAYAVVAGRQSSESVITATVVDPSCASASAHPVPAGPITTLLSKINS